MANLLHPSCPRFRRGGYCNIIGTRFIVEAFKSTFLSFEAAKLLPKVQDRLGDIFVLEVFFWHASLSVESYAAKDLGAFRHKIRNDLPFILVFLKKKQLAFCYG